MHIPGSVPIPKFANAAAGSGADFGIKGATGKSMIPVWLLDLKFLSEPTAKS
jgi:hypothetical protein